MIGGLFYNKMENEYYYVIADPSQIRCDRCDCGFEYGNFIYHHTRWTYRLQPLVHDPKMVGNPIVRRRMPHCDELVYCGRCLIYNDKGVYDIMCCAEVVREVPAGCVLVIPQAPFIQNRRGDLEVGGTVVADNFLVASDMKDGAIIIDRTEHAGDSSIEGASIGADLEEELAWKDRPVSKLKDCSKMLLSMKNAVRVIEYGSKAMIELKKEGDVDVSGK